jgi:hypothetical protein
LRKGLTSYTTDELNGKDSGSSGRGLTYYTTDELNSKDSGS